MKLSEREKEILKYFYLSNREIGKILGLARGTVQGYFAQMTAKNSGAKNRIQLFFKALKDGEIRKVDLGFWDENGKYISDVYIVDLRKE